jgi:lysophospholipid acyltransferase (LPLAT)-like uncharacterized protein
MKIKSPQISKAGSLGMSLLLPWLKNSLDIKISHFDPTADPSRMEFGTPNIYVFWHEYIVLPTILWGNTNVTLFVSMHRDADWLVNIAKHQGFDAIRGSTTRGGSSALRSCREKLKTHSLAVTPDGPKGPRRCLAMGAVYLASRLQIPIVPIGFGYQNPFRLRTWDHFAVPKPGSRIRVLMGPKIRVPRKADRGLLEDYRLAINSDLNLLTSISEQSAELGTVLEGQGAFLKTRKYQQVDSVAELSSQENLLGDVDLRGVAGSRQAAA